MKGARLDVQKLLTEALQRESFRLEVSLTAENANCHKLCTHAVDENFTVSAASPFTGSRVSLGPPALLPNAAVFPDGTEDFTADGAALDDAKVDALKSNAVLSAVGRIVRSDFLRLIPFTAAERQEGSGMREWKLFLSTCQGPMAKTSWRYDTLCDPRFDAVAEKVGATETESEAGSTTTAS